MLSADNFIVKQASTLEKCKEITRFHAINIEWISTSEYVVLNFRIVV